MAQHTLKPGRLPAPSDCQWMVPSSGITPSGPLVPQKRLPLTTMKSYAHSMALSISTSNSSTVSGSGGKFAAVHAERSG